MFSADYEQARRRFRTAARLAGAETIEIPISAIGPGGLRLSIDVAWLGATSPSRVVLHVSGIHGLEAFSGSAVQLAALASRPVLPSDAALVFVHGLNPWGAAWLRRNNENNVDLNRNFLLDVPPPEAPRLYRELHPLLNPPTPPSRDYFLLRMVARMSRHGFGAIQQVIAGGQYEFPHGLFYGGRDLEEGPRKFLEWLIERLTGARRIVALDLHTGLGRYASDFLFVEAGATDEKKRKLLDAFGRRIHTQGHDATIYRCTGTLLSAIERLFPEAHVDALCQEFGTFPQPWVLKALRQENRFHFYGGANAEEALRHPLKRATLRIFHPPHWVWRRRILALGDERLQQAIAALDR